MNNLLEKTVWNCRFEREIKQEFEECPAGLSFSIKSFESLICISFSVQEFQL
jgi:hypothetical protein